MHSLPYSQQTLFKIASVNDLNKVDNVFKQLTSQSPFRMAGRLKYIMSLFTGTSKSPGLIPLLIEESFTKDPHQWVDKMEKVVSLIGPKSAYIQTLKKNSNLRVSIEKNILPPQLNSQTKHLYEPFHNMVQDSDGISLPAIDWYYTTLVCGVYNENSFYSSNSSSTSSIAMKSLPITNNKVPPSIAFDQDDFFFIFARNPWFVLLRKHMQQGNEKFQSRRKIVSLIKAYFVDPLIMKYSNNQIGRSMDSRNTRLSYSQTIKNDPYSIRSFDFSLKVNGILSVFLALIFPCANQYQNSLQTGNISVNIKNSLQEYFLFSIEHFHLITSYRNNNEETIVLRFLIRTWLLYMRPYDNIEKKMVENLKKANSKDGWFNVKKYTPQQFHNDSSNSRGISSLIFKSFDIKDYPSFSKIVEGFVNLFRNSNNWTASLQYFHSLSLFVAFLKINSQQIKRHEIRQSRQNGIAKSTRKNVQDLFKNKRYSLPNPQSNTNVSNHKKLESLQKMIVKFQQVIPEAIGYEQMRLSKTDFIQFFQRLHICIEFFYKGLNTVFEIKSQFPSLSKDQLIEKSKNHTKYQSDQIRSEFRPQRIVTYYATYRKNPWETPLSEYQSYTLKALIYPIVKGMHFLTPKAFKGDYPMNLRFLINPYSLLLIILLFAFIFNWLFSGDGLSSESDMTK